MSGPTVFKVTERLGPVGTLAKLPVDYREATLDFTRWLGLGEIVTSVAQYGIQVDPEPSCNGSWSVAFDCGGCCTGSAPPGPDTTPLQVIAASVLPDGKKATVLIGDGTPGLTYGVSFLALVSPTNRRKEVDLLVCIGRSIADMGDPLPPPPVLPLPLYMFVTGSTTLPQGFTGSVFVNNTSGGPITITMPPLPVVNQNVVIKDIPGNSSTYPITINCPGYTIDGQSTLVIRLNYGWAELTFGLQWMQV